MNLGAYLALSGKRTLVVDLDPQGNATISCGIKRPRVLGTIYEAVEGKVTLESVVVKSVVESLDVIPSSIELSNADLKIAESPDRETVLKRLFEPLRNRYDIILFDCPPSLGLLTTNALVASDRVLIPVQCEYLALEGLHSLMRMVDRVKTGMNPNLKVVGIVLTMADFRTTLTQEVAHEVKQFFRDTVLDTSIPRNVRLAESPSFGRPICLYDPNSSGALAYDNLAKEVMRKIL